MYLLKGIFRVISSDNGVSFFLENPGEQETVNFMVVDYKDGMGCGIVHATILP